MRPNGILASALVLASISLTSGAFAQSGFPTWTNAAGGAWSNTANWSGDIVADGVGNFADFSTINITADPVTVQLDNPRTLGGLIFGDADTTSAAGWVLGNNGVADNVLTLSGGNTITVNELGVGKAVTINANIDTSGAGLTKLGAGTLVLGGRNNLNTNQLQVLDSGTLSITGTTTGVTNLFLRNTSTLILDNGAALTTGLNNAYLSIGLDGDDDASVIVRGNAVWTHAGSDFNISDVGASKGSLTVTDTATFTSNSTIFVSKNSGTSGAMTVAGNSNASTNGALLVGWGNNTNGTLTQSGGSLTVGGNLVFGEMRNSDGVSNATGSFTKSGGTLTVRNELWVGNEPGAVGTYTQSAGDSTVNNWFVVGRHGAKGTVTLSGGSLNHTGGNFAVGDGGGSVGEMTVSGDSSLSTSGEFWVGQGGGTGTLTVKSGNISLNNWVAIGREGGTGTINLEGGTINKATSEGTAFIVGTSTGTGTLNQTGGAVAITSGNTWIGENGTGTWNLSAGTLTANSLILGRNGTGQGTLNLSGAGEVEAGSVIFGELDTAHGTLNLNGGTLRTAYMQIGTGTAEVNFNGGTIQARFDEFDFLRGINADNSEIKAGGLTFDTNGASVAVNAGFDGEGGLTKKGDGTLLLNAASTYAGPTKVDQGTLAVDIDGSLAGGVTVATGATLGGRGKIGGNVVLQGGAHLDPGVALAGLGLEAQGTLTLQTGLSLNSSGGNVLEFGLGTISDLLAITGGTFLGNETGFTGINITAEEGFAPGVYKLIDWTGSTATGVDLADFQLNGVLPNGYTGILEFGQNSLQLNVVPEPSAAALLAVIGAGLLGFRRRRAAVRS